MKKIIILIFIILVGCGKKSQEKKEIVSEEIKSLDATYIASKTKYFTVKNDSIIGEGNKVLKDIFKKSQFVVFGERHSSKETSKLIKALVPVMNDAGFKTVCMEIGPSSAKKIKELSSDPEKTIQNLASFNSKYKFKPSNRFPIPFFYGVEDADFLKEMAHTKMDIWGLDQEFYYSIFYLTDELLKCVENKKNFETIKKDKENADKNIRKWFLKESNSEEEIDIFSEIKKEQDVITFFNHFTEEDKGALEIINNLKITWDIYSRWRKGSHVDRISYMRNNFLNNFNKKDANTKVFLKFGQLHASQIISNGAYDLGHLVNELANEKDAISTNINSFTRFYKEEDGLVVDNLKKYSKYYKRLKLFMELAKRDAWTIIDLKSIREDVLNKKIKLPSNGDFHKINALIQGYDYQLILPLDEYITKNEE